MQQVNLYTEEFQPRKVKLPLEQILLITFATIALVALLSVALSYSLESLKAERSEQRAKAETMRERIAAMEAKAATLVRDESLVLANGRLAQQLNARRQMIDVLDTVVVKDDAGFSGTLIALARQRVDSLWLTRISLGSAGSNMVLEGATNRADAVPEYLQNLRQESSFVGRTFGLFSLEENEDNPSQLRFRLRALDDQTEESLLVSTDRGAASMSEVQEGVQ